MTMRRGLKRKIGYLCGIGVLLLPLAWLSQPATGHTPGGVIAQQRTALRLSPADLGQIDPTGEALKLATLGMRGIAAQVLWWKAFEYQKDEDYPKLSATNEQITKLMPNYVSAWRFQCWNLSYNVSVEFDDYRDRYFWVIKGIKFLQQGIAYNELEPRLRWDEGWFICQKIGRSDERKLYRVLFRKDDDFHGPDVPESARDNWLVGKGKYILAQRLVDEQNAPLSGMNPVIFHSDPAMAQINYAAALEEDGTFGERAAVAWAQAAGDWEKYGAREFAVQGGEIRLSELELFNRMALEKYGQLVAYAPEVPQKIRDERIARLSPEDQALARKPPAEVTLTEAERRHMIDEQVIPNPSDIVEAMPAAVRETARGLANDYGQYAYKRDLINSYRNTVNYEYWRLRCEAERTEDALVGRRSLFAGDKLFAEADLQGAKREYEEGLRHWRAVLDKYPHLVKDGLIGDELVKSTGRYQSILKQLDEPFPQPFILQDVIDFQVPKKPELKKDAEGAPTEGQKEPPPTDVQ